jgi:hypothetical protein
MAVVVSSCGSGSKDPAGVVKAYVKALDEQDFSGAKKMVTERFYTELKEMEQLIKANTELFKSSRELVVNEHFDLVEKTDSTAKVFRGGKLKDSQLEYNQEFGLVKEKGKWLIDKVSNRK